MKHTARQIGRLFTIEKPTMIYDEEAKKEIPHHSAQNDVEVYKRNFHEYKHELLKYRIEKQNSYSPSERISPTEHEVKQELMCIEEYVKAYQSEPKQINNWLRYYEPKKYRVLLEMYRDFLKKELSNFTITNQITDLIEAYISGKILYEVRVKLKELTNGLNPDDLRALSNSLADANPEKYHENKSYKFKVDELKQLIYETALDIERQQMTPEDWQEFAERMKHKVNLKIFQRTGKYPEQGSESNKTALQNTEPDCPTKAIISEALISMDKKGWQYAFSSESDFNLFTDLLAKFFKYEPYELPENTIRLKKGCKTKIAKELGNIHGKLSNEDTLISDAKFFEIVRVLSRFKDEPEGDLYKALTR